MDLATLQSIGRYMCYQGVVGAGDLFQAHTRMMRAVQPEMSEEDVLGVCAHWTVALSQRASCDGVEGIMVMEDAGTFLDQDDTKTMNKAAPPSSRPWRSSGASPRSQAAARQAAGEPARPSGGGDSACGVESVEPQAPTCGSQGATAHDSVVHRPFPSTAALGGTTAKG